MIHFHFDQYKTLLPLPVWNIVWHHHEPNLTNTCSYGLTHTLWGNVCNKYINTEVLGASYSWGLSMFILMLSRDLPQKYWHALIRIGVLGCPVGEIPSFLRIHMKLSTSVHLQQKIELDMHLEPIYEKTNLEDHSPQSGRQLLIPSTNCSPLTIDPLTASQYWMPLMSEGTLLWEGKPSGGSVAPSKSKIHSKYKIHILPLSSSSCVVGGWDSSWDLSSGTSHKLQ